MRRGWLIIVALMGSGCYSESVLRDTTRITPQTRLSVELTPVGALSLAREIGDGVDFVEGIVRVAHPDTLHLAVVRTGHPRRGYQRWAGEPLSIPVSHTASIAVRAIDKRRTALLAAGLSVAAFYLIRASTLSVGGIEAPDDDDPPPTPDVRLP